MIKLNRPEKSNSPSHLPGDRPARPFARDRRRFLLAYLLLYALLFAGILLLFLLQGRSLVYHSDAWRQHVRALSYYGKWLRGILYNLFVLHTAEIPAWSFGLGYGGDILTTLQYYCIGEPLTALSVFVPARYTKIFFEVLMVVRPFLAGLSFASYAGYLLYNRYPAGGTITAATVQTGGQPEDAATSPSPGRERSSRFLLPLLVGSLLYAFCGTVLYIGMLHPYFVTPMIWLPLLLLGIERMLRTGRPGLLMLTTCLAGLSNFYFFYILMLLAGGYALVRVFVTVRDRRKHFPASCAECNAGGRGLVRAAALDIARELLRLLACVMAGAAGAGCILIPVVIQYGSNPRSANSYAVSLFYDADYYAELPVNLVSFINHPQFDTELCMGVMGALCVVALFLVRGHRQLKTAVLAATVMLCLPAAGYVLNGFSYVINRWTFAAELLISLVLVLLWCDALEGKLFFLWQNAAQEPDAPLPSASAVRTNHNPAALNAAAAGLTAFSLFLNLWSAFRPGGFASEFMRVQTPEEYETDAGTNEAAAVAGLGGSNVFYRYTGRDLTWNASLNDGISSTQFCWSLANGSVSEFFEAVGNRDEQNFAYYALDDRIILNALAGVKYYVLPEWDTSYENTHAMYGYVDLGVVRAADMDAQESTEETSLISSLSGTDGTPAPGTKMEEMEEERDSWESGVTSWHVYENAFALPLGYTYTDIMTEHEFYELSMTQRQEALLQCVILEDEAADQLLSGEAEKSTDAGERTDVDTGSAGQDGNDMTVQDGAALTGTDSLTGVHADDLSFCEEVIPFTLNVSDGVTVTGDGAGITAEGAGTERAVSVLSDVTFHVTGAGAQATLEFQGLENAETYLSLLNLSVEGNEAGKRQEQYSIRFQSYASGEELSDKELNYHTPLSQYYSGWTDYAVNLGYSSLSKTSVVITFPAAGDYTLQELQLICQPAEEAMSAVALRLAGALDGADLHENPVSHATGEITGTVTEDRTRFLVLNIPWSEGWTAYVDGVKTDLQKANIMFMGLTIPQGEHELRLVYRTPGGTAGLLVSLAGIAAMLAILAVGKRYGSRRQ